MKTLNNNILNSLPAQSVKAIVSMSSKINQNHKSATGKYDLNSMEANDADLAYFKEKLNEPFDKTKINLACKKDQYYSGKSAGNKLDSPIKESINSMAENKPETSRSNGLPSRAEAQRGNNPVQESGMSSDTYKSFPAPSNNKGRADRADISTRAEPNKIDEKDKDRKAVDKLSNTYTNVLSEILKQREPGAPAAVQADNVKGSERITKNLNIDKSVLQNVEKILVSKGSGDGLGEVRVLLNDEVLPSTEIHFKENKGPDGGFEIKFVTQSKESEQFLNANLGNLKSGLKMDGKHTINAQIIEDGVIRDLNIDAAQGTKAGVRDNLYAQQFSQARMAENKPDNVAGAAASDLSGEEEGSSNQDNRRSRGYRIIEDQDNG